MFRRPLTLAAFAVAVLWLCQFATVRFNYGGNWTGLFCIASKRHVPEFLRAERLYLFADSDGYDGQMFHLIAHDPWMKRGSAAVLDGPAFRYQRIFVPALAWTLALGHDQYIHAAYYTLILGFVFVGVFWLARLAQLRGLHPVWGLAFIAVPATITSLDRMTADVALAAFCVGFMLYVESGSSWRVLVILACATLTKETALLIIAGYCLFLLTQGKVAKAIAAGLAALPAGAWLLYVTHRTPTANVVQYLNWRPLYGFLERVMHPRWYSAIIWKNDAAVLGDWIALAGVALLFIDVAYMVIEKRWSAGSAAIYILAFAVVFLRSRDVWLDSYNFGRVLSPLLLLVFLENFAARSGRRMMAALAPMLMMDVRISLNLLGQLEGIARGLLK